MRPIKLAIENFGPYRERAEIDFTRLGEFFLICGKTGSGKSTLFDALSYALFGQAPGARKGSEASLVSDFAKPGDKPTVEFEFSLSGTVYRVLRSAPFSRPKRGGGFAAVPPAAALFAKAPEAAEGWRPVAEGVRDTTDKISGLIGLSADEFSKIILLPQGDFQKFLEMESGERSKVLEKLFPVGLQERLTEIAKARTQEAGVELSFLTEEIGRLQKETGEGAQARLEELRGGLREALEEEGAAMAEAAARERALEREKERAARAARAGEAARALEALEARGPAEAARAERIAWARAAAAARPFSLAFAKAKAAALDLTARSAALAEELGAMEAAAPQIEEKRLRARQGAEAIKTGQKELFGLQKALEIWKRREEAFSLFAVSEKRAAELKERYAQAAAAAQELKNQIETLRPKAEEEASLRGEFEALQERAAKMTALAGQAKRRAALFAEMEKNEGIQRGYGEAHRLSLAESEKAAAEVAALEKAAARSQAAHLAEVLRPGQACPVCGSLEHPHPAKASAGRGAAEAAALEKARADSLKLSKEAAGFEASLKLAARRGEEISAEIEGLDSEMRLNLSHMGKALSALVFAAAPCVEDFASAAESAGLDKKAADSFAKALARLLGDNETALAELRARGEGVEKRRREALAVERELARENLALEKLRGELDKAGAELVERRTVLSEAERLSGTTDPEPAYAAAALRLEAFEKETALLADECAAWEERAAVTKAKYLTLEKERDDACAKLETEFARLGDALSRGGFLPMREAKVLARGQIPPRQAAPSAPPLLAPPLPARPKAPPLARIMADESGGLSAAVAELESLFLPEADLAAEEKTAASYREALAAARAEVSSLAADLAPQEGEGLGAEALETALAEARKALSAARSRSDAARLSIDQLEKALARRAALEAQRETLEKGSRSLYRLSELLRGDIAGRHLPFKNFILAMYFREVARRASIHLSRMSDGRYYLKSDEGQASGRGKIGLGLRVLDTWTGLDRSTNTLSGGEKFLTSISLALGLADSIREQNGGVSLDSVFIDEGFGSLDDEALDRAISVLDKIRGGRVIGIVSHVAALRSRIAARIEVEKTASGSRLSQSLMFSDQDF